MPLSMNSRGVVLVCLALSVHQGAPAQPKSVPSDATVPAPGPAASKGTEPETKGKGTAVPLTILVINRETRQTFVYPAAGVEAYAADPTTASFGAASSGNYSFVGITTLPKALASAETLNTLAPPLATRAAVYAQALLRDLRGINFVASEQWTAAVLKVVGRAGLLKVDSSDASRSHASKLAYAWPLHLPLLTTALAFPQAVLPASKPDAQAAPSRQRSRAAALFVVECRADGPAGVVEQVDLMAFRDGRLARTYWTRDALDPTYFVKTDKALTMVAERFQSRLMNLMDDSAESPQGASQAALAPAGSVVVGVHRLLPESAREAFVKVTRALTEASATDPLPVGVDANYVYYQVSLREAPNKTTASDAVLQEALKKQLAEAPQLFVVSLASGRDLRLDPPATQVKPAP